MTRSDTSRVDKSNGQTTVASVQTKAAVEAQKSAVAVKAGPDEKIGFAVADSSGHESVQVASDAKTHSTSTGNTASAVPPPGRTAVVHGHIDSGPNASNGMVDSPRDNGGLGDTSGLKQNLPVATVSN